MDRRAAMTPVARVSSGTSSSFRTHENAAGVGKAGGGPGSIVCGWWFRG
jgi:hypothetical protein